MDGVYTFSMLKVLPFAHRKNYMLLLQLAAKTEACAARYLFMYLGVKTEKVRNYAVNLVLQYLSRAGCAESDMERFAKTNWLSLDT